MFEELCKSSVQIKTQKLWVMTLLMRREKRCISHTVWKCHLCSLAFRPFIFSLYLASNHWFFQTQSLLLQKSHSIWVERVFPSHCESAMELNKLFGWMCNFFLIFNAIHKSTTAHFHDKPHISLARLSWSRYFCCKRSSLANRKPSLIFGSAVISTSCSLRAGCLNTERMALTRLMVLFCFSAQACLRLFFQKLPRNSSLCAAEM